MGDETTKVLLADAHTCRRIGLAQLLSVHCSVVIAASASRDELKTSLQHQHHVLLLACNLLPQDPVPFVAQLHRQHPHMGIALFVADCEALPLLALTNAGVQSIVAKGESMETLVQIVPKIASGQRVVSPEVIDKLLQLPPKPVSSFTLTLDELETHLLRLICAEKSNARIATVLHTSPKTVERRLTALFRKLGVQTRVGAAVWFVQHKNEP